MADLLRRIRGAAGIGAAWSIPWGLVSSLVVGVQRILFGRFPSGSLEIGWILAAAIGDGIDGAIVGFITGSAFGAVLSIAERRRTLASLNPRRFSLLGATAGAASASVLVMMASAGGGQSNLAGAAVFLGVSTAMGAACAALTLKVARSSSQAPSSSDPNKEQLKELASPDLVDDLQWRQAKRTRAPVP